MQQYLAVEFLQFHAGHVALTAEQQRRRRSQVRPTGEPGIFEIMSACGFKTGERFGYDGDVPKSLHEKVMPIADPVVGDIVISDQAPPDAVSTTDAEDPTEPNAAPRVKRKYTRRK